MSNPAFDRLIELASEGMKCDVWNVKRDARNVMRKMRSLGLAGSPTAATKATVATAAPANVNDHPDVTLRQRRRL
jgi:hypothetical protein